VVELQAEVARLGFSSAAVYGSLSPAVRRREAARFRAGEADVLVATDAIGLGLNLPIRRIVFATTEKYDGAEMRALSVPEVRQIAGRAGRYGIHEEGLVTALDPADVALLRRAIERRQPEPSAGPIWIAPTDEHLARLAQVLGTARVSRLLRFFQTRVLREPDGAVRIADLSEQIEVAATLETSEAFGRLPLAVRSAYSRAPVANRGPSLEVLLLWADRHARGEPVEGEELMAPAGGRDRTLVHEDQSRTATLYLWLSQRFPNVYTNRESVLLVRESIDDDIQAALLARGAKRKVRKAKRRPVRAQPARRRG
jgi:ATP-dependent RNA helicase SUPV3L1/SUV3